MSGRLRAARFRVGQQVARDPEQPWPDRLVIAAQLGQMPPGPDEGFLDDVIGARLIWTEPPDVAVQGLGMLGVQLADRGIGVAGEIAAGSVPDSKYIYYHG